MATSWLKNLIKYQSVLESLTNLTTQQELLDLDFLRKDVSGNIIDGDGNIITGSPSVADYTALLALDEATYENFAVIVEALNRAAFLSDGTLFAPLNGQYVHEVQTLPGNEFTSPNNVTWTAADNGAGKVRLTASGAHGLTGAKSNGKYLRLLSGGTGWTAGSDHQIDPSAGYIDATNMERKKLLARSPGNAASCPTRCCARLGIVLFIGQEA